jgi:hypothetical protein
MGTPAGLYLCMTPSQHGAVVHHPKLLSWVDSLSSEHIDAATGGSFFTLSIEEARKLVEKMASNQSWDEERTQTRTRKVLTTKIDLLMKKLENPGLDHLKMVDARVTCEECEGTCHMGINCLTVSQDVDFIGNSNNGFCSNQGFNVGWNKPSFPFDNYQLGGMGQNFHRNHPSLRDIIRDQVRINEEIFSTRQECHACCDKFSSRTGDLNL